MCGDVVSEASVKEAGIVEEDGVNASDSGCRGRRLEGGKWR